MKSDTSKKLITCIVPRGRALPVLKMLHARGIVTANIYHARGSGRMTPMAWRGVGETSEKDVMNVVVDATDSEEYLQGRGVAVPSARLRQKRRRLTLQMTTSDPYCRYCRISGKHAVRSAIPELCEEFCARRRTPSRRWRHT